jgi:hypothetical protein
VEHPLELRAFSDGVGDPLVERAGAVKHRIELIDIEGRRMTPVYRKHPGRSLVQLGAWIGRGTRGPCVALDVGVELVNQCFVSVNELVHDLYERRDCGGT